MPILNFTFEELPLIIDAGFEAGLVNGSADVSYLGDDCTDWCIHNIVLDGNKAVHHTEHAKAVAASPAGRCRASKPSPFRWSGKTTSSA